MTKSQLIPQRDQTMLVTPGEGREALVDLLRQCAQFERIIAGSYLYRVSPVAIWGAAARGVDGRRLVASLEEATGGPLQPLFARRILEPFARYGVVRLRERDGSVIVACDDPTVLAALATECAETPNGTTLRLAAREVGPFRIAAARAGWPVVDERPTRNGGVARYTLGAHTTLRGYQKDAVHAWLRARDGVVLLPCGAGKTVVGVAAAAAVSARTLVLTPSRTVAEQWIGHFRALTTIDDRDVVFLEREGRLGSVTVGTYHQATMGASADALFDHPWELVIYDEVQSLPADVFRTSAAFSSHRRLGLTATLVREDGREREVAALIGPVVYDIPWTELERDGWIAPARCVEVRTPAARITADNLRYKVAVTRRLLAQHPDDQAVLIGTDVGLMRKVAVTFDIPLITGKTSPAARAAIIEAFRAGASRHIAVTRVGSVGIDVPAASVLIQLSGTFGSRQEEAQRLGRILRPGPGKTASFYSVVLDTPRDIAFAERRQRFLVDQGYRYEIVPAADLPRFN